MRPAWVLGLAILLGLAMLGPLGPLGPAPSWPDRLEPGPSPLEAWDVIDAAGHEAGQDDED